MKYLKLFRMKSRNISTTDSQKMNLMPAIRLFILSAILSWYVAPPAYAQEVDPILDLIQQSDAATSFWSYQVRNPDGRIIEEFNGEHLIRPASNLKLVTSAAFLDLLGPDYTFETTLFATGSAIENRWEGDLYIRGTGDPSINGEAYDDPLFLFRQWAEVFDSLGIDTIEGDIIAHDGFFDDVPYPRGWEWDDLSYYYAPEISALSFNFNVVDLEVIADGEPGTVPSITWFPFETTYVEFINEQRVTPANTSYDESYRRELGRNKIYLRSTLPRGMVETEPLSVPNPSLYFIDTFRKFLGREGITHRGNLRTMAEPVSWQEGSFTKLHEHRSKPLYTMIQWMNRESDNLYTEMLLKVVAAEKFKVPGSTELGLEAVKDFMQNHGFDTTAVTLRDASGMAPATLLKTSDLNRFLVEIQSESYFDRFYNSLSVGGQNGTLSFRFGGGNLNGNFHGKSGFLSGVRSISGYLTTREGNRLIVTIATNNYTVRTSSVDRIHEQILEYLYSRY